MSQPKLASLIPQTAPPGTPPTGEVMHISSFGIVRRGNAILLMKKLRPERHAGRWTLPASVINYGEDPAEAMKRIVASNLGKEPTGLKLIDLQSYGVEHWDLCCVYDVQLLDVGTLSKDVEKVEYFDASNLPRELVDGHREVLQLLIDRKLV
jgi:ADP-ribose pyrophosphatase YjhB (NUDIX family)